MGVLDKLFWISPELQQAIEDYKAWLNEESERVRGSINKSLIQSMQENQLQHIIQMCEISFSWATKYIDQYENPSNHFQRSINNRAIRSLLFWLNLESLLKSLKDEYRSREFDTLAQSLLEEQFHIFFEPKKQTHPTFYWDFVWEDDKFTWKSYYERYRTVSDINNAQKLSQEIKSGSLGWWEVKQWEPNNEPAISVWVVRKPLWETLSDQDLLDVAITKKKEGIQQGRVSSINPYWLDLDFGVKVRLWDRLRQAEDEIKVYYLDFKKQELKGKIDTEYNRILQEFPNLKWFMVPSISLWFINIPSEIFQEIRSYLDWKNDQLKNAWNNRKK